MKGQRKGRAHERAPKDSEQMRTHASEGGPPPPRGLRGRGGSKVTDDLSLMHVTEVGAARLILAGGQIESRECSIFGENLTYFFLMRPAYRTADGERKSEYVDDFPVVFVVSPKNLGTPFHVYPFDTGAALAGLYADRMNKWVVLESYELETSLEGAARHIAWAFGDASSYYDGDVVLGLKDQLPQHDSVARSFLNIAGMASREHNKPDKRASAIEVAYRDSVKLKGNVLLAVLPKQFLYDDLRDNDQMIEALDAARVPIETYDWQPNKTPDECHDDLTRIVRRFLVENGQIQA